MGVSLLVAVTSGRPAGPTAGPTIRPRAVAHLLGGGVRTRPHRLARWWRLLRQPPRSRWSCPWTGAALRGSRRADRLAIVAVARMSVVGRFPAAGPSSDLRTPDRPCRAPLPPARVPHPGC